jgi:hypothetical protein
MIGIEEISKYRTSDGMEFEDDNEAMVHEIDLAIKDIRPEDLIVKDKLGRKIELRALWWRVDSAYYVEVHSEIALDFFNEASRAEGMSPLERGLGLYRYEDYSDSWTTPIEDAQKLWEQWEIYNKEIRFATYINK